MPLKEYNISLPIEKWIYEDEVFQKIANSIDFSLNDDMKCAHEFYARMTKTFEIVGQKIVKSINNNGTRSYDNFPHFLSIQTAILKFLLPDDPVRQNLVKACYHCLNKDEFDITESAEIFFGAPSNVPNSFMVYFREYGPQASMFFEMECKDWTESGAHTPFRIFRS